MVGSLTATATASGAVMVSVTNRPASASTRQAADRVEVRAAHCRTVAWRASGQGTRVVSCLQHTYGDIRTGAKFLAKWRYRLTINVCILPARWR